MRQMFVTYGLTESARIKDVTDELIRRGYDAGAARRAIAHSIQIRVREDTNDRSEVDEVMASLDPGAHRLPDGAPTMTIPDYRGGQS